MIFDSGSVKFRCAVGFGANGSRPSRGRRVFLPCALSSARRARSRSAACSSKAAFASRTDGGHYENLGLVELLRRGCTEIYCFDASNDNFDAIGDAVALARSEFGVEVDVKCKDMEPDAETGRASKDCVSAEIKYPGKNAPPATLYYARLVMTDEAPADVIAYHRADPHFPHDPTADQLYTDQRFEAYRALGANTARSALAQRDTSQAEGCCRRLPASG